ncbi:transposase, putative [Talaromyces stipitatus ATCC 10500]|uniref:Transposase, putative n=1 Tax=Talaromyces stipitatus (strain ATCC 10500 / CBS 375.48 / QM 6759 / NRRL 1006) TaxID=441959 RepID=B8MPS9_TALSN|nr:transposase, putative [Talaromyces stipitatus ATCC 10500]EED12737.1 transposase, putative [Talaromyces stipitatus ATCC 10500]
MTLKSLGLLLAIEAKPKTGFNTVTGHKKIDPTLWEKDAGPGDSVEVLVNYTIRAMYEAAVSHHFDRELFEWLHDYFEEWTLVEFNKLDRTTRSKLKDFLQIRGVYLDHRGKKNISEGLVELLQMDIPPRWPDDMIAGKKFDSRSRMALGQQAQLTPRSDTTPPAKRIKNHNRDHLIGLPYSDKEKEETTLRRDPERRINNNPLQLETHVRDLDSRTPLTGANAVPIGTPAPSPIKISTTPPPRPSTSLTSARQLDEYMRLPPTEYEQEDIDPSLAAKFSKAWDKAESYSGERYDILDDKVLAFLRVCRLIGVQLTQCWILFPEMLSGRAKTYYMHYISQDASFTDAYKAIKAKTLVEAVEILIEKLHLCQCALGNAYKGQEHLVAAVTRACQDSPEMSDALSDPATNFETLVSRLRARAAVVQGKESASQYLTRVKANSAPNGIGEDNPMTLYTDRKFLGRTNQNNRQTPRQGYRRQGRDDRNSRQQGDRKCWICHRSDCRSFKYSDEERRRARERFNDYQHVDGRRSASDRTYRAFVMDFEKGCMIESDSEEDDVEEEDDIEDDATAYFMINELQDRSFIHWISGYHDDINQEGFHHKLEVRELDQSERKDGLLEPASQFVLEHHEGEIFQGILPDTGAAKVSTVGQRQLAALQRSYPEITVDRTRAGEHSIRFGQGESVHSKGAVTITTPIDDVDFHIMNTPTPFLLCLDDMDKHGAYLDNIANCMVKGDVRVPIIRKRGHPWFFLDKKQAPVTFLTEIEMRRLHRRFGHPAVDRLHKLLKRAGHDDMDYNNLAEIEKFCHHCQMNRQAPRHFKFTLNDDREFNYEIVVDVMYLDGKPVLHVVDWATSFQAARFLKSLSAKDTWEALRAVWIDTYLGPPDVISHDAGTNFAALEFKTEAKIMGIQCHQVPVEAHNAIGKVERYHAPLRRAYNIISAELGASVDKDVILQMAIKAVNDTVGPDGIVPTVLVFGAYPRITTDSPPSALTARRAEAMRKAMAELRRAVAERRVNDALNTRNGPIITETLNLAPGSEVKVWREGDGWSGPYKVISVNGHDVTVDLGNGAITFRVTSVQQYLRDSKDESDRLIRLPLSPPQEDLNRQDGRSQVDFDQTPRTRARTGGAHAPQTPEMPALPRRRGRPRGSKNKPKAYAEVFISKKERDDLELAIKLRREGKIATNGAPFELSGKTEIDSLIENGTFKILHRADMDLRGIRIFNSRLVNEIKGKNEIPMRNLDLLYKI